MKRNRRITLGVATGLGAVLLALWRRDIPYETLEARYGGPTSRTILTPDGIRLHYRDTGRTDGPVMVLLHGYSASSLDWVPWVEQLGRRYRMILVDLPGHGLTAAPPDTAVTAGTLVTAVAALFEALRLRDVVLVGSSMGGQVAWHYAVDHPGRLSALVLVGAVGWSDTRRAGRASPVFRLIGHGLGRFALRHLDMTPLVKRGMATAFGDAALVTPDLLRRCLDFARAPGHRTVLTTLQLAGGDPHRLASLASIEVPTLIMAGEDDRLVPARDARRFSEAIPGATLKLYPGVGHLPMQQIPARSARDVGTWLEEQVFRR